MQKKENLNLELSLPEGNLQVSITIPVGMERVPVLVLDLLPISDLVTQMGARIAQKLGAGVSCARGCGACCRQLVPLAPPEAVILAELTESLPEQLKTNITHNFAAATTRLAEAGLLSKLTQLYNSSFSKDQIQKITHQYFNLQIPCPFLVNESCCIYGFRPSRCREYSVISPSDYCADPYQNQVRLLPVSIKLAAALARAWATITKTMPVLIPLTLALDWNRQNEQARYLAIEAKPFVQAIVQYVCQAARRYEQDMVSAMPTKGKL